MGIDDAAHAAIVYEILGEMTIGYRQEQSLGALGVPPQQIQENSPSAAPMARVINSMTIALSISFLYPMDLSQKYQLSVTFPFDKELDDNGPSWSDFGL